MINRRPVLGLCTMIALAASACVTPATEVLVVVDTDAPMRLTSLRALVSRGSTPSTRAEMRTFTRTGSAGDFTLPASFAIIPGTAANDSVVTLSIDATFSGTAANQPSVVATRTARFRFIPHTPSMLRVFIPISCSFEIAPPAHCANVSMPCTTSSYCAERSQTCGDDGTCVAIDTQPVPIAGDGGIDASRSDGRAIDALDTVDASVPIDALDSAPSDVSDVADASEACAPQCAGRSCGADSCGGSCGSCTSSEVCDPSGNCTACVDGSACMPTNPCATGRVSCGGGTPVCNAWGNTPAGSNCDPGHICDGAGHCVVCSAGTGCAPSGMPCRTGSIACDTGAPVCAATGNVGAGISCGSGMVCNGSGSCVTCAAGTGCITGNPCTTGTIDCSSGAPVCQDTGNVAPGTSCGSNMVCNGGGGCIACAAGMSCSTGNPCTTGAIACTTGSPACQTVGNAPMGTACGSGMACDGSGSCVSAAAPCAARGEFCTELGGCSSSGFTLPMTPSGGVVSQPLMCGMVEYTCTNGTWALTRTTALVGTCTP